MVLAALRARARCSVTGVEISEAGVRRARESFGLDVIQGTFPGVALTSGGFDLVFMMHVLEHVPDPRRTITEIARVLKPGGVLHCLIPNCASVAFDTLGEDWHDLPRHLYFFTPHTLSRMVEACGLRVERIVHSPIPNDRVRILRAALKRVPVLAPLAAAATLSNPLALLAALPWSIADALAKRSGRMTIIARKEA